MFAKSETEEQESDLYQYEQDQASCSLSRAKERVNSREPVSNVECEGTRLTDAGT